MHVVGLLEEVLNVLQQKSEDHVLRVATHSPDFEEIRRQRTLCQEPASYGEAQVHYMSILRLHAGLRVLAGLLSRQEGYNESNVVHHFILLPTAYLPPIHHRLLHYSFTGRFDIPRFPERRNQLHTLHTRYRLTTYKLPHSIGSQDQELVLRGEFHLHYFRL